MKKSGFTLIELLVGIAIVGILSTALLAVLNPLEQIKKGRDAQRKHDLAQIQKPLEVYYNDHGVYPTPVQPNGLPFGSEWIEEGSQYMAKVPQDPLSPAQTYAYRTEEGGYRLFAKLERCPENQTIKDINCATEQYNYSVVSPNLAVVPFGGGGPAPSETPIPTVSIPTSTVSVPTPTTSVPTPTSTVPTPTPGGSIKRVFVTSDPTYNGNLGGLSGADQKCLDRANAPGARLCGSTDCPAGSWKAWLSDSTGSPSTRFSATVRSTTNPVEFRLIDGTTIANGWGNLTTVNLLRPIYLAENGASIVTGNNAVFTDTSQDGLLYESSSHCQNWTSPSSFEYHRFGNNTNTDPRWTKITTVNSKCNNQRRLYCFEQ